MSDREISPARSGSANSIEDKKIYRKSLSRSRSGSGHRSRSKRSRSRSYSPRRRYRSRSRSPAYKKRGYKSGGYGGYGRGKPRGRKQYTDGRENPPSSRCLGIFGLSIYTTEQQINHIFGKYGPVERVQVVIDAKTGRSRGFCFVYFENRDDAGAAKEACSGMEIDGRQIRVDFSVTQRAHTPTPGIYMGRPTYRKNNNWRGRNNYRDDRDDDYYDSGYRGGGGGGGHYSSSRRSPSPYYSKSRRDYRSRSRSYSPRHY